MTAKENNRELARQLNIAVALLNDGDLSRIGVRRDAAVAAIDSAIERLCQRRDEVCGLTLFSTWSYLKGWVGCAVANERDELARRKETVRAHKAVHGNKAHPARDYWDRLGKKMEADRIKTNAKNQRMRTMAKVGEAVVSLFDSTKVGGQAIGGVWYSQLENLRNKGAFEASLCQAILHHGKPSKDAQVKDLITENVLAKFVADANRALNRVKAAA